MKRLLLISYFFPPIGGVGSQRALRFARYLPDLGWDVTILTPDRSDYPIRDQMPTYRDSKYRVVRTRGLDIPKRGSRQHRWIVNNLLFPDERALWRLTSHREAVRLARDADVIMSSSAPVTSHIIASRAASVTGVPWVADFRDPYVSNPGLRDMPHRARHQDLEMHLLQSASRVIVVTPQMQGEFQRKTSTPVGCVTNGFDPDEFVGLVPERLEGEINVLHLGSLYGYQTLDPVLAALSELYRADPKAASRLRVYFIGRVADDQRQRAHESDAAAMIRFLPFVPRHRALRLMLGANALLLLVSRELAYAATGKVFDYIASRTPVIALVPPGIAASVVSSAGGEVVCDAAGLAQSLHRLTGGQVSHRPEPPDSSLVGYAARSLAAQLDAELEAACDIHGGQA